MDTLRVLNFHPDLTNPSLVSPPKKLLSTVMYKRGDTYCPEKYTRSGIIKSEEIGESYPPANKLPTRITREYDVKVSITIYDNLILTNC